MDKQTIKATIASAKHWDENSKASTPNMASVFAKDCALCDIYQGSSVATRCGGCPVSSRTGELLCKGSPYTKAAKAWRDWSDDVRCNRYFAARESGAKFRSLAARERDYLVSLLPKNVQATISFETLNYGRQLLAVYNVMKDGRARTLLEIERIINHNTGRGILQTSISARLRDQRS
jgi:hypothetical protein